MAMPGENGNEGKNGSVSADAGFPETAETPDGEYRFKNGYGDKIYADAHYVPENENTEPPKYYKPPERPVRVSVSAKKKKKDGFFLKAVCLCLICALLGGLGGAAIVGRQLSARIEALEQSGQATEETALFAAKARIRGEDTAWWTPCSGLRAKEEKAVQPKGRDTQF